MKTAEEFYAEWMGEKPGEATTVKKLVERVARGYWAAGAEAMRERMKNAFPTLASPIDAEVGPIFPEDKP